MGLSLVKWIFLCVSFSFSIYMMKRGDVYNKQGNIVSNIKTLDSCNKVVGEWGGGHETEQ